MNKNAANKKMKTTANKKVKAPKKTPQAEAHIISNQELPTEQLVDAPYNPRKSFDEAEVAEMASSMRAHGVLEPLLVRLVPDRQEDAVLYEVISGHKRLRAARLAGLRSLPCRVHSYCDDKRALGMSIIANLHSSPNPLEKGAAYRQFLVEHGLSVEAAAAYLGESVSGIRALLALRNLPVMAEAAVIDGRLSISTAGLIARVPDDNQKSHLALCVLTGNNCTEPRESDLEIRNNPLSFAETKELIEEKYMRQLKGAPWKLTDVKLLPAAGSCTQCPKRAGNAAKEEPDLYANLRADMCLDVSCYLLKLGTCRAQICAEARAAGRMVIIGAEAEHAGRYPSSWLLLDAPNAPISIGLPEGVTLREYLAMKGIELVDPALAVRDDGRTEEIVAQEWAFRALQPAPSPAPSPNSKSRPKPGPAPLGFDPAEVDPPPRPAEVESDQEAPAARSGGHKSGCTFEDEVRTYAPPARPTLIDQHSTYDAAVEKAMPLVLSVIRERMQLGDASPSCIEALRSLALASVEYLAADDPDEGLLALETARDILGVGPGIDDRSLAPWAAWMANVGAVDMFIVLVEIQLRSALEGLPERRACRALLQLAGLDRDTLIVEAREKMRKEEVKDD